MGGAFDGEYVHLSVGTHLLDSLLVPKDSKERDCHSFQWDPAHIIELAESDAKKKEKGLQYILSTISKISQEFSHGKSYRQLLEEVHLYLSETDYDSSKETARPPGHYSDTRFATYSCDKKLFHNYKYYYRLMNKEQDDDVDRIDNAPFLFSSAGLSDVYETIGKASNAVQKHDIPPC